MTIQTTLTSKNSKTQRGKNNPIEIEDEKSLQAGWKWCDQLKTDIAEITIEPSVKVCTGYSPIASVNVDAIPFQEIAKDEKANFEVTEDNDIIPTEDAHNEIGGKAVTADYQDLPFDNGEFFTTISDPPWKSMSRSDRKKLLEELSRITRLGGRIIINSPWISNSELVELEEIRLRQDRKFWGGPSTIAIYRKYPSDPNHETALKTDQEERSRLQRSGPFRKTSFLGQAISEETKTDPRFVDRTNTDFCCPHCNSPELAHVHSMYKNENKPLYECLECNFRAFPNELISTEEHRDKNQSELTT